MPEGTNGERKKIRKTVLDGANLTGAILLGADFRGADLSNVKGLTQQQLTDAIIDDATKLPRRLKL